jgi:hypothetical protein
MAFEAVNNRDRLNELLSNMNELQIQNMMDVLDIYVTIRSLWEIETRMNNPDDTNIHHEEMMRWVVDFRDMISGLLKTS